ncbi:hypothetical protein D3C78_1137110 [compost metagenome]
MGAFEVAGIDAAEVLANGGLDDPLVDQRRYLFQQVVLLDHVLGLVQRACEHELPVHRQRFALERHDIEMLRVIDQRELALWAQHFDDLREVRIGVGQADDVIHRVELKLFQLQGKGCRMVDDMMCPEFADPGLGFRA